MNKPKRKNRQSFHEIKTKKGWEPDSWSTMVRDWVICHYPITFTRDYIYFETPARRRIKSNNSNIEMVEKIIKNVKQG